MDQGTRKLVILYCLATLCLSLYTEFFSGLNNTGTLKGAYNTLIIAVIAPWIEQHNPNIFFFCLADVSFVYSMQTSGIAPVLVTFRPAGSGRDAELACVGNSQENNRIYARSCLLKI